MPSISIINGQDAFSPRFISGLPLPGGIRSPRGIWGGLTQPSLPLYFIASYSVTASPLTAKTAIAGVIPSKPATPPKIAKRSLAVNCPLLPTLIAAPAVVNILPPILPNVDLLKEPPIKLTSEDPLEIPTEILSLFLQLPAIPVSTTPSRAPIFPRNFAINASFISFPQSTK